VLKWLRASVQSYSLQAFGNEFIVDTFLGKEALLIEDEEQDEARHHNHEREHRGCH
jgi:hypothetical protein